MLYRFLKRKVNKKMKHSFDTECHCSIFYDKNINLTILSIHTILIQIENFIVKDENIDNFYNSYCNLNQKCNFYFENFLIHCKVSMIHMSQHKTLVFIIKCNLKSLLFILKQYYKPGKIIQVLITMISADNYESLKWQHFCKKGDVNYELLL